MSQSRDGSSSRPGNGKRSRDLKRSAQWPPARWPCEAPLRSSWALFRNSFSTLKPALRTSFLAFATSRGRDRYGAHAGVKVLAYLQGYLHVLGEWWRGVFGDHVIRRVEVCERGKVRSSGRLLWLQLDSSWQRPTRIVRRWRSRGWRRDRIGAGLHLGAERNVAGKRDFDGAVGKRDGDRRPSRLSLLSAAPVAAC